MGKNESLVVMEEIDMAAAPMDGADVGLVILCVMWVAMGGC